MITEIRVILQILLIMVGCSMIWLLPKQRTQWKRKRVPTSSVKNTAAADKLNVLFILLDDLRPSIGVLGDKEAITPHLDQLGGSGTVFSQTFAQIPLCGPSRTSLLTSRRPDTTLSLYNGFNWREVGDFVSMPEYFKIHGYHAGSVGKIFHNMLNGATEGFGGPAGTWSQPPYFPQSRLVRKEAVCLDEDGTANFNILCSVDTKMFPNSSFSDVEVRLETLRFLKKWTHKIKPKPFFYAVGLYAPHPPFKLPSTFMDLHPLERQKPVANSEPQKGVSELTQSFWTLQYKKSHDWGQALVNDSFSPEFQLKVKQHYYAAVSYVDHQIGQIIQGLAEQGLLNKTIISIVGDHGYALGEHGLFGKQTNLDVALHVPWLVLDPRVHHLHRFRLYSPEELDRWKHFQLPKPAPLHNVASQVEMLDIFPTLVDLVGLPNLKECPRWNKAQSRKIAQCTEGMSQASTIRSGAPNPHPGRLIFSVTTRRKDIHGRKKDLDFISYSVRDDRFRYVAWYSYNRTLNETSFSRRLSQELYDHEQDPGENENRVDGEEYQIAVERLSQSLLDAFSSAYA